MSRDLRSCALTEEKQNFHMFNQIHKRGKWENIKKQAAELYQEP